MTSHAGRLSRVFPAGTNEVVDYLAATYGWDRDRAYRVLAIATEFGIKCEATKGGYVQVTRAAAATFAVEDHTGRTP